ncbi:hypothetical protein [Clostridium sp. YIM B02500]|uniref:hypothetical protein n=1 Tax=Clostridium sp. YIM B02500 TaxID=2910681 RepID=UPI001EED825B|nr:hypothetical protein [Clostridium sp. YIM B02500]
MGWKITDKFLVDPQDSDSVPFDQGGIVRRSTWGKMKDYILGNASLVTNDKTVRGAINEVNTSLSDLTQKGVVYKTMPASFDVTKISTWTENGIYLTDTNGVTDLPVGWAQGRHVVVVFNPGNASYGMQIIAPYQGSSGTSKKMAFRNSIIDGSVWKELANSNDLNTHTNALMTDTNGVHGFKVETGTWTPVLKGLTVAGNNSYSQQAGRYVKHDKLITCFFRISISAKDANMAGDIHISGLPYSSYNVNANKPGINIGEIAYITLPTGCTQFTGELISGGNTIQLVANGGSYATTIKESNLAAYPTIIGSITYETTL